MLSDTLRDLIKALLAEGALALLVIHGIQLRHGLRKHVWATWIALFVVAIGAIAGYAEFGWVRYGTYMNNHDFYHYYTGSKYAPEIGYYNQYAASFLADQEGEKAFDAKKAIRNLKDHGYTPTAEVFADEAAIKGRFSPERWEAFKKDIHYFQDRVPDAKWQQMLRDKGYNGTPVWSMVAGVFTNAVSTDNSWGMIALVAIDPILLGIMFLAIWWAFGPWTALFAIAFFGTNFVTDFVHIKGALMRMDWVAALVISMCLLHKQYFRSAGVLLAYAAAARIFPFVFSFGIGALAVWELLATRKINRDYIRFFLFFGIATVLLGGIAYLYYGAALWQEFIAKIGVHNADISTTRVGFKYLFLWPFESFGAKVSGFEAHQSLWWKIQAGMLLVTFVAARKMKPYQALGLGFIPAFFLTAPTFYYYVYLIVPLMVFLPDLRRPSNVLGASLFFATSIAAYALKQGGFNLDFPFCVILSCMYGALGAYMAGLFLLPERARETASSPMVESASEKGRRRSLLGPVLGTAYVVFILALFFYYRATPAKDTPERNVASDVQVAREVTTAPQSPAEMETPVVEATLPPESPSESVEDAAAPDRPRLPSPPKLPAATGRPELPGTLDSAETPEVPAEMTPRPEATTAVVPQGTSGNEATVTLALVGDIMLTRNVERDLKARNLDFTYPFEKTAPMLQTADIAFGNLECPISGRGEALPGKRYLFNAAPESIEGPAFAGFDVLSLANNHTLDFGTVALEDTVRIVGEKGIAHPGITTGDAPQAPVILERNGLRVGFLAYVDPESPYGCAKEFLAFETGPARATNEALASDIAALNATVDLVVVSLHWGIEYEMKPNQRQVDLGQFVIDQGADVVAGHHPHVQQDAAWYKGKLIVYSLGNFVFDQWSRPPTLVSRLYSVTLTREGPVHAQYRPLEIVPKDWQPRPTGPNYVAIPKPAE